MKDKIIKKEFDLITTMKSKFYALSEQLVESLCRKVPSPRAPPIIASFASDILDTTAIDPILWKQVFHLLLHILEE